ncbi:Cyclin-related protein [Durusdinium trenchii]|uniref:Putative n=1 Tax=Durusdinium trenchii TaxID=1381693 RepID=A0ABP0JXK4_9DINO
MIVTESQPVASDHQETQLLCSPTQLLHTTAAIETLAKVDAELADGIDINVEIPDHEVVTRRRQFRMKKEKAEKRAEKKLIKQKEQKEKKTRKEDKNEAKKTKDKTKKQKKEPAQLKKEGRTAKEKKADRAKSGRKKRSAKRKGCAGDAAGEDQHAEGPATAESAPETAQPEDANQGSETLSPCDDGSKKIIPVRSRQMKRLRRMGSSWKTGLDGFDDEEPTAKDGPGDDGQVDEKAQGKKSRKAKKGEKKTKKGSEGKDDKLKKQPGSSRKKDPKSPKKKSESSKKKQNGTPKAKAEPKKSRKRSATPAAAKAKASKGKRKPKGEVDETVKGVVLQTLKECRDSNCTHPSFELPKHCGMSFSPYWTRCAVGLNLERKYFQNEKAQGTGKAHLAYFGGADHIAEEIKKLKPDPCSAGLESIKASLQASLSAAVSEWQGSGHQDTS